MSGTPGSTSPNFFKQRLRQLPGILLTIALGTVGGYLFLLIKMPLAWMMGAMCFTTAAALAGIPLRSPGRLREYMVAVIGLMVGSAFTPDVLDHVARWITSLSALAVYTVLAIFVLGWALCRIARFHPADAFCSAAPGGFAEMVILGGALGGDERKISLMHSVRIVLTVILIPFWFRIVHDYVPGGTAVFGRVADLSVAGGAILVACGIVGYWGGKKLRVPLYFLTGPLILSALVHAFGISAERPPGEIVAVAQIIIGVGVGCRFVNTPIREIVSVLKAATLMTIGMLGIAILFAYGVHLWTGLSLESLILAYSPGGVAEMNVITVTLHIDPVFVATHHLARLMLLMIVAPLFLKLFTGWGSAWTKSRQSGED